MQIKSAKFVKGIVGPDELFEDGKPQIAFIGRSNVGKSSVINALTNQKGLAKTSSFPGRTQQLNIFVINKDFYLVDLPGYGYARLSKDERANLQKLIGWYLFESPYVQKKVVLIIDANVGLTDTDIDMLEALDANHKSVIIVANKIDKIKNANFHKQIQKIRDLVGDHHIIEFSAEKGTGVNELKNELLA